MDAPAADDERNLGGEGNGFHLYAVDPKVRVRCADAYLADEVRQRILGLKGGRPVELDADVAARGPHQQQMRERRIDRPRLLREHALVVVVPGEDDAVAVELDRVAEEEVEP